MKPKPKPKPSSAFSRLLLVRWYAVGFMTVVMRLVMQYFSTFDRPRTVLFTFYGVGAIILWTTFRYTVLDYAYYQSLADRQQTIEVANPVSRGSIFSNNDPYGVFATSTALPDLAIDPQQTGSKERLIVFLSDIIFDELCSYETSGDCSTRIFAFLREGETDTGATFDTQIPIKDQIVRKLREKIAKQYVDFVTVQESVNDRDCVEVNLIGDAGVWCRLNTIYANPTIVGDRQAVGKALASILHGDATDMESRIRLRTIRYLKLFHRLSLRSKDKIDTRLENERDAMKKGLLPESDSIVNYIILESIPSRFYPEKNIASEIVGFVDNLGDGHYGVEGYFNEELKGKEGMRITKKDVSGKMVGSYTLTEQDFINGSDLVLTIDRNIQKEVTRILADSVAEFRANRATAVIMDPTTGAIVSMVTVPDFDPNHFGDVYAMEKVSNARYSNPAFDFLGKPIFVEDTKNGTEFVVGDHKMMLRTATDTEIANPAIPRYKYVNDYGPWVYVNDAIGSLYEPGSVFKVITVAIGIDTGDIKPTDMYLDKGSVDIDQYTIHNVDRECMGYHTYVHALDWSCNVGMIDIVQKIGKSLFYKYLNDFGFSQKTNVTLDGEVFREIEPYEKWSRTKLFTMSFGQGISVTPLQMATAYSVIANGGLYIEPHIIDTLRLPNGTTIKNAPNIIRRVISEETAKKVSAMMVEGVQIGFAKKGAVPGYDVAGKTGTSQIAKRGGYEQGGVGHTVTSFGGFAPAGNPKFVLIVKIDRPRTAIWSETTSSVMFQRIASYLLNYYGIPKNQ